MRSKSLLLPFPIEEMQNKTIWVDLTSLNPSFIGHGKIYIEGHGESVDRVLVKFDELPPHIGPMQANLTQSLLDGVKRDGSITGAEFYCSD